MKVLVTGAAGFIGYHLCKALLCRGDEVCGVDIVNDYYDPGLKNGRLADLGIVCDNETGIYLSRSEKYPSFEFSRTDIADFEGFSKLWATFRPEAVVNLAAQPGVRYSLENPWAYIKANVDGFLNVLECCRQMPVKHLVYASSSSVYGDNAKVPFDEDDEVKDQASIYAVTKRTDELMAMVYHKLYGVHATGLRFFTVYGPWGRPDMAPVLFAKAIMEDKPIKVFNHGNLSHDFTYIDDIVGGILKVIDRPDGSPKVYNIGHGSPVNLMDFITTVEKSLGKTALKEYMEMQPGDVHTTYASVEKLRDDFGYEASTSLDVGIERFISWFKEYYKC